MNQSLPLPEFADASRALSFHTPVCKVNGACDLYTMKSTAHDKKLFKRINNDLSARYYSLLKLGKGLPPEDRKAMLASSPELKLFTHSSPFGPLSNELSRRIFAYLIAILNTTWEH